MQTSDLPPLRPHQGDYSASCLTAQTLSVGGSTNIIVEAENIQPNSPTAVLKSSDCSTGLGFDAVCAGECPKVLDEALNRPVLSEIAANIQVTPCHSRSSSEMPFCHYKMS